MAKECLTATVIVCCAAALGQATPESPIRNVVLIMADDVGYECFGCYGSQQYTTPRIDALARQGVRFTHCYSQPLCTPSRVKLMTGMSNAENYAAFSVLRRDQTTLGQYFQTAGFRTMVAGKWQLLAAEQYNESFRGKGSWPSDTGFDQSCLWQVNVFGKRYWQPLLNVNGRNQQFDQDTYGPDQCTTAITDFISQASDKPFFVYYPMILVHSPFLPTPDSSSRKTKAAQQNFEDMVAYMDVIVGRIVDHLVETGHANNTLVIFTSDNGTHRTLSSRLDGRLIQGGKGLPTDAGTRVPLVAYCPGTVPSGVTCDDLVDFNDFLPTLLSATGIETPKHLEGISFLPQLLGQLGTPRQIMYCYYCPRPERTPPIRFVRNKRWKLYGNGSFFDIQNDVLEQHPVDTQRLRTDAQDAFEELSAAIQASPAKGQSLLEY